MFIPNSKIKIYEKKAVIYEGEPPDNLNIELYYSDEDVKFQIKSSVSLTGENNKLTITGEYNGSPVSEEITCTGYITEGSTYFDYISSIEFSFEIETNIKIRGITSNGDDNESLHLLWSSIDARVRDLKWSKTLIEMGVIFEKSKMIYLPIFLTLNNNCVIEYDEENYSIIEIARGLSHQEVIITRID